MRLCKNREFMTYWLGQSVSQVGTAVSYVALPLVAVIFLHVDAFALGIIVAAEKLAPLVLGPFVGPLVDNVSRRALMLIADWGRALLLGWIPIGAMLHVLSVWHLPVIGFLVGALTMMFNLAGQAFLPRMIPTRALADGNGKLEASQSVADVTGPGIASWLIAIGGAPLAVGADAVSYVASGCCIWRLRTRDADKSRERRTHTGARKHLVAVWHLTTSGFGMLWSDRIFRTVAVSRAVLNFFAQFQMSVYFLYLVDSLHLTPSSIGAIFALSGVAGFFTAIGSKWFANRIGLGYLVVAGQSVSVLGGILLASAFGSTLSAAAIILAGEVLFAMGMAMYGVGYSTLIQIRVPDQQRGRVSGASRFMITAALPAASILGGAVGAAFGPRMPLIIGAAGMAGGVVGVARLASALRADDSVPCA